MDPNPDEWLPLLDYVSALRTSLADERRALHTQERATGCAQEMAVEAWMIAFCLDGRVPLDWADRRETRFHGWRPGCGE